MKYAIYAFNFDNASLNGLNYNRNTMRFCFHNIEKNSYFNIEQNKWVSASAYNCWYTDLNDLIQAVKKELNVLKIECEFHHC